MLNRVNKGNENHSRFNQLISDILFHSNHLQKNDFCPFP